MSEETKLKITGTFSTDQWLMYCIQDITKLSSIEILGFFSDLGKHVAEVGIENIETKGQTLKMRKEINDVFPNTQIPFRMLVTGGVAYSKAKCYQYRVSVFFPESKSLVQHDQDKLSNIIMENALLGGNDLPPFEKPKSRTTKIYKDLMKEIQSRRMV